jgi:sugar phosphate isomerase/epimerase
MPSRLLLALLLAASVRAGSLPDELKINGFALGCQAYTFRLFSVFEAIDKTAYAGGKVIEFFPGQKLSPEEPEVKFSHDAPPEVWAKVQAKCREKGITPIAYGVVGIPNDEKGARKVFDFAKALGIRVINTESDKSIDMIEKMVKEYDIKVGFHDHPIRDKDPSYRMWDPNYILELVKDRDPRIGSCADIGHWVRSRLKPVECLKILKGRIVSSHMKDLHAPLPSGHDVHWGQGVSDVPAVLAELRAQGFEGPISVEYEHNWENNAEDAKACIDFVKAWKP